MSYSTPSTRSYCTRPSLFYLSLLFCPAAHELDDTITMEEESPIVIGNPGSVESFSLDSLVDRAVRAVDSDLAWQRVYVPRHFKPEYVERVLAILADPTVETFHEAAQSHGLNQSWYLDTPTRFQFDPAKNITKNPTLKKQVRALANREPDLMSVEIMRHTLPVDIFQHLWPGISLDTVAPTPETRVALGVVALLAHLSAQSPRVYHFLNEAPDRPNYEFHLPNALLATLKYTVKPTLHREALEVLLTKTLALLVSLSTQVPDMGRPPVDHPFPLLATFTHSFIDLLACTPRLIIDFGCGAMETCESGYRVEGHFLDALHVDPHETATLAELVTEFEQELIQGYDDNVPLTCRNDHPLIVHEYHYQGPPPLLFFEAKSKLGIPRASIDPQVSLTAYSSHEMREYVYDLVAVVSMEPEDVVLELHAIGDSDERDDYMDESETLPVALVIYVRCDTLQTFGQVRAEVEEEDEEGDSMDDVVSL